METININMGFGPGGEEMRRHSRKELYREICQEAGLVPDISPFATGYFNRKEMTELLLYLQRVRKGMRLLKDRAAIVLKASGDSKCEQRTPV